MPYLSVGIIPLTHAFQNRQKYWLNAVVATNAVTAPHSII